ncbi:hypothetical protein STANM309S_03656 [Streptomyces tanashiensis]
MLLEQNAVLQRTLHEVQNELPRRAPTNWAPASATAWTPARCGMRRFRNYASNGRSTRGRPPGRDRHAGTPQRQPAADDREQSADRRRCCGTNRDSRSCPQAVRPMRSPLLDELPADAAAAVVRLLGDTHQLAAVEVRERYGSSLGRAAPPHSTSCTVSARPGKPTSPSPSASATTTGRPNRSPRSRIGLHTECADRPRRLRIEADDDPAQHEWLALLLLGVPHEELVTRSRSGLLEASPADAAASEGDEGVVEFSAAFPADGEALVEQGEGLLDYVAELADALDSVIPCVR